MSKKSISVRMDLEIYEQLQKLIEVEQDILNMSSEIKRKVTATDVIQLAIKERYNRLKG